MSHMVTRKGSVGEDKEKRQTDSPVKEMKKKIAANAEKEKIAAEKTADKSEKPVDKKDKVADKPADKASDKKDKVAEKQAEKASDKKDKGAEKQADKSAEKQAEKVVKKKDKNPAEKNVEKAAEKKDKSEEKIVEKPAEKPAEKKEKSNEKASDKKEKTDKKEVAEKSKDEASSGEKSAKQGEKPDEKVKKPETAKLNGGTQNGQNGAASSSDDDELVIVEQPDDNDEMFPELAYDDNSDADGFEPELAASRSLTRRSQVKATRTPETPRPASAAPAQQQRDAEHSKEPKLLRLKEDSALTERRLRSADSPKKTIDAQEAQQSQQTAEKSEKSEGGKEEKVEMEVVIEVESSEDGDAVRRDTRFSRSRVKVSPYRRSARLADASHASFASAASHTSLLANYTGNNTTMEMDITEPSISESGTSPPPSPGPDDSYLIGLRAIRGRRSYKQSHAQPHAHAQAAYAQARAHAHAQLQAHAQAQAQATNATAAAATAATTGRDTSRPTGTVVGRKRRPDASEEVEEASEAVEVPKRARLLDRLARPFRTHSTPLPARRAAQIVGINTDLPLSAPVAAAEPFDAESIKPTPTLSAETMPTPTISVGAMPTPDPTHADRDSKRCIVM